MLTGPLSHRECILVVDDNALNRKLFTALLESRGYDVLQGATGSAGLNLAREYQPDLIVLDLQLPDLFGLEVALALKADDTTRDIPIIAVTASLSDWERDARAAGCEGFMTKPIPAAEFLTTVQALLRRIRSTKLVQ